MIKKKSSVQFTFKEKSEPYTFEKRSKGVTLLSSSHSKPKKSLKHALPAILASLAVVFGVAKLGSQTKRSRKEPAPAPKAEMGKPAVSVKQPSIPVPDIPPLPQPDLTSLLQQNSTDYLVPSPDLLPLIPPTIPLRDRQDANGNSISTQLFSQVSIVAPKGTTTNELWQCTDLLQQLSTDTNNVCKALNMPRQNFTNFVNSVLQIPSNEVDKVIQNVSTNNPLYSFKALSKALIDNTTNTQIVAQEAFLLGQRYKLHNTFAQEVPTYEGDKDFVYWDKKGIPTTGKGSNLQANSDMLSWLRFENSDKLRKILTNLPENQEYITLTSADLRKLTDDVKKRGFVGKSANFFKTEYGLSVHPDDLPRLDEYFHKKVAKTLTKVEKDLENNKPTTLANESVLFGSFESAKQVPLSAAKVLLDICYNTGNNIRVDWPNLTNAYENRNFLTAKEECEVNGVQESRNTWHKNSMQEAHDEWRTNHPAPSRQNLPHNAQVSTR